jgi:hypothetical protein
MRRSAIASAMLLLTLLPVQAAQWQPVAAVPENFAADCGDWLVPATSLLNARSKLIEPDRLLLMVQAEATTVVTPPDCQPMALKWRLPDGMVTTGEFLTPIIIYHDEHYEVGYAQAPAPGLHEIFLMRLHGHWSASNARTYVWGQFNIPVKAAP